MRPFEDKDRYHFPLRPESVVVDVGAYHGNWSLEICRKYGCTVLAFEPIKRFYEMAGKTLADYPNAVLFHAGMGPKFSRTEFGVQNDSTGAFSLAPERETVTILPFVDTLRGMEMKRFDLLKLNMEGGEYALLEDAIERDFIREFRWIIIQFHTCVPGWQSRYEAIARGLEATHELEARQPFVWEKWSLK